MIPIEIFFLPTPTPYGFDHLSLRIVCATSAMTDMPESLGLPDTGPFHRLSAFLMGCKFYLLAAFAIIIYLLHLRATKLRVTPKGVPWVGLRDEWFPKTRANIRELTNSKSNVEEGYQKVKLVPHIVFRVCCPAALTGII